MLQINPNNIPDIQKLVDMTKPVLHKRKELNGRINRGASQSTTMFSDTKKVQIAFEQQNIGVATGYLGGIEPTIKGTVSDALNKEYLEKLNDILRYNDFASKHINMVRDTMSANAHYMYINYDTGGRFTFSGIDSRNAVAFYDYAIEPNLVLLMRQWQESDGSDTVDVAEIITATAITQYESKKSGAYTKRSSTPLMWGDIPVCSFEGTSDIALIEPVVPIIKMYEQIMQNIASMTEYNDNAKLLMVGYQLPFTHLDKDGNLTTGYQNATRALLEAKVLEVDKEGDFRWLLKDINYSGMLEVLKTIHQLIMFIVASPDTTDTSFTAAESSLALRLKMFPFEQRVTEWKALYKKQYLRLIEIITNRLNFLKSPSLKMDDMAVLSKDEKASRGLYDFANIEVEINVNVPSEKLKTLNVAEVMARIGKFSDRTILAESGIVKDVDAELEAKHEQDLSEYDEMIKQSEF